MYASELKMIGRLSVTSIITLTMLLLRLAPTGGPPKAPLKMQEIPWAMRLRRSGLAWSEGGRAGRMESTER